MLENDGSASWGCPEGTKVLSNYSSVAEVFYVRGNCNQHEMAEGRINDGLLRHPLILWHGKSLMRFIRGLRRIHVMFASALLPMDSIPLEHSISNAARLWPVLLIPSNLPPWPWLCMKQPFWIMSMIIPGPKSPGNYISLYLQPLIEELKREHGVSTYDAVTKRNWN